VIYEIEQEANRFKSDKIYKIDVLYNALNVIDRFFENVKFPMIYKDRPWLDTDILSSIRYNTFLQHTQRDIGIIYDSMINTKNGMISSWNNIEVVKQTDVTPEEYYDMEFPVELPLANKFVNVTSAVVQKSSHRTNLKFDPEVQSRVNNIRAEVYHGKKYGVWIPNDITNEDGIHPANKSTDLLVDNKDTFYEIESVVLQQGHEDVHHSQDIVNDELILTATIKVVFNNPIELNYFTIKPHNHASGKYYEVTDIVVSNGRNQQGVTIDNVVVDGETTITFQNPFEETTAAYITFKQVNGYFIKYSIGSFILDDNTYVTDITGDALIGDASKYTNAIDFIKFKMNNISTWILDVIKPNIEYKDFPVLNTGVGDNGFTIVESDESRRKRWVVGIEDIDFGKNGYAGESEIVTNPIDIPEGSNAISVIASDNNLGTISYYISLDDGLNWNRIDPIGTEKVMDNFLIVPQTIFINSDISLTRQDNNEAGSAAYINSDSIKVRLRAVLITDEENIPEIYEMKPLFDRIIDIEPSGVLPSGVIPSGQIEFT